MEITFLSFDNDGNENGHVTTPCSFDGDSYTLESGYMPRPDLIEFCSIDGGPELLVISKSIENGIIRVRF